MIYDLAGVRERNATQYYRCHGVGHLQASYPNLRGQRQGVKVTSIFVNHGCYNCGERGHNQDRCPKLRRFCIKCNFLGHTQETVCMRGKKREGGALPNPRPTPSPPEMKDGFVNIISQGMYRRGRLDETSRLTPKSVSKANGTLAPPTGPAGARPPR